MNHKSGFVNIIGNPNVGKSTLMNALVGEKLSIITSKSQTTRHRIRGIVNGDDFQIVYSDTPGIIKPNYELQESMVQAAKSAISDADILLYVTDVVEKYDKSLDILKILSDIHIPIILVLNKIDLTNQETLEKLVDIWKKKLPKATIFPVSALNKFNLDNLFDEILSLLPEFPPYFGKDELTDRHLRFFVSEIIREKLLLYYQKEIPYACEVVVNDYIEEEKIINIHATIFVERESQKGIIIGKKGIAIKKTGTEARKDIEEFVDKKVFLELHVKVSKDWRHKKTDVKKFGYNNY